MWVCMVVQVCQELERQAERAKLVAAHDGVDLEYLKNIMLKLYETGDTHCQPTLHICLSKSCLLPSWMATQAALCYA